jgi:uncharacterized protein (DUF2141 family)
MRAVLLALFAALAGCATPIAPTGGPPDTTAPALVRAAPADGTTGLVEPVLTLTFSERIDPASATRAVRVSPAGPAPPRVEVRARDLQITLPALRDSTTYVVTVGTELTDLRRVRLAAPLTLAFATGSAIDRGRIEGIVRDPATGDGVPGMAVWATLRADSASALPGAAPDYETETGTDGRFRLDYLRPGSYAVVALADRNRNRRADPAEPFAAPPAAALAAVVADSAAADSLAVRARPHVFWATVLDTIPPVALRARALSDRRLAVRFSEPARILTAQAPGAETGWLVLEDSLTGQRRPVRAFHGDAVSADLLLLAERPLPTTPHTVRMDAPGALADSSGNEVPPFRVSVTPSPRADTLRARFAGFVPAEPDSVVTLQPDQQPGVRFTAPPPDSLLARLSAPGLSAPLDLLTTDGLTVYTSADTEPPSLPVRFRLRYAAPDTTVERIFRTPTEDETGGIVGQVADSSGATIRIEAVPDSGGDPFVGVASADGRFEITRLPPGTYRLRLYADRNGNGRWDGGALAPYVPPEPLRLLADPVEVRARWETELDAADLSLTDPP